MKRVLGLLLAIAVMISMSAMPTFAQEKGKKAAAEKKEGKEGGKKKSEKGKEESKEKKKGAKKKADK